MADKYLIIEGARQNNLKNINLQIPHNKVTVITGISGSGKSSLAFDTIFAEGQWRYIESLSTYTRMFLDKIDRPDVDAIRNIRPAIAIEQKNTVRTSRSTVGTATEIYDYMRLLFARIGVIECSKCGSIVKSYNPSEVSSELIEKYNSCKAFILAPVAPSALKDLVQRGFFRVKVGENIYNLQEEGFNDESFISSRSQGEMKIPLNPPFSKGEIKYPPLEKGGWGDLKRRFSDEIYIIIDRTTITASNRSRLTDSIETAFREGDGSIAVEIPDTEHGILKFDKEFKCHTCDIKFEKPGPLFFSFNHPLGACPSCKGFGDVLEYDEDLIVPDKNLSLNDGAVDPWTKPAYLWWQKQLISSAEANKHNIDLNKPYSELTKEEHEKLFKGSKGFEGINDFFTYLEGKRYKLHVRVFLSRYRSPRTCNDCKGSRLKPDVLNIKVKGLNIYQVCNMSIGKLLDWFNSLSLTEFENQIASDIIVQIKMKLRFLLKTGLSYLTLHRQTRTLSGGETQRITLANQLGSRLVGTLYVLDEPSIGLHSRDTDKLAEIVRDISSAGNTVIVVEHDRTMIEASDYVVEIGPGGGEKGGRVVFSGEIKEFMLSDCLTSQYISGKAHIPKPEVRRTGNGKFIILTGAKEHNLKNITLKIPLHTMTCITGVSGSGKSTLIQDTLYKALARYFRLEFDKMGRFDRLYGVESLRGVKLIDQTPIGRTPRSNPITYIKAFDTIRKIFADRTESKLKGFTASSFSFNTTGGRCEACQGSGFQKLEMYFFEDMFVSCEKCDGKRYKPDVLKIKYKGKNISETLQLTVQEASEFFSEYAHLRNSLKLLDEAGIGYLRLGQPATTLSGGEAQRLKICSELIRRDARDILYLLDEPTTGLHFDDIKKLLNIFNRLVDNKNTVVIIEHNMDVIKCADYIVDLGPEGGDEGGEILAEGTPEEIIKADRSYTGQYLKNIFSQIDSRS